MPSFDVVSEIDNHEVTNAVDQANREINTRFDFKRVEASFEEIESGVALTAEADFQLQQMLEILRAKLAKRSIDVACMEEGEIHPSGKLVRQEVILKRGIDKDLSRQLVKLVKASKLKVQVSIQGDKVRVTGKKRDELQQVIALLKEEELDMPLQFNNFRD